MAKKPLSKFQIDTAVSAIDQVREFLTDGGLDGDGKRAAALSLAVESLLLVRRHWAVGVEPATTPETSTDGLSAAAGNV